MSFAKQKNEKLFSTVRSKHLRNQSNCSLKRSIDGDVTFGSEFERPRTVQSNIHCHRRASMEQAQRSRALNKAYAAEASAESKQRLKSCFR